MRVYTRGVDEGLMIDNRIQVNVLEVFADGVRLAIIDPDSTPSYREEVLYVPMNGAEDDSSSEGFDQSGYDFTSFSVDLVASIEDDDLMASMK